MQPNDEQLSQFDNTEFYDANSLGIGFFDVLLKKYALFKGRARRKEFWMFVLIQSLIRAGFFVACLSAVMMAYIPNTMVLYDVLVAVMHVIICIAMYSIFIFEFISIIPFIALGVRRMHDIGKSGWFVLINFIPYVGILILLVLCCFGSQPGPNKYGPNPKEI